MQQVILDHILSKKGGGGIIGTISKFWIRSVWLSIEYNSICNVHFPVLMT